MVAGFAHEVRNPLAAMRSLTEELGEELRDGGHSLPHVGLMLQLVERIERLVKTSLQFGRPAAPVRGLSSPRGIAAAALEAVRPRVRDMGENILFALEPDLPDINVDERQLVQVLVILLNNALDATGVAPRVTLRVRARRPREADPRGRKSDPPRGVGVLFEVVDDGPGIPADNIGRIFDPFFTTKPSGTGLGLSIAQQIVNENGAHLEVTSSPGVETTFAILVLSEVQAEP